MAQNVLKKAGTGASFKPRSLLKRPPRPGLVGGSEAPGWWECRSEVSYEAPVARQGGKRGGCDFSERVRALPQQRAHAIAKGELGRELEDGEVLFERRL